MKIVASWAVVLCGVTAVTLVNSRGAVGAEFHLRDFSPQGDGVTDDTPALQRCFAAVARAGGGCVTIPPGNYFVRGDVPVPLVSNTTVLAYGARFLLPPTLGDGARLVVFAGQDVCDFRWSGGHFQGNVFDPAKADNTWEPNANARGILITTTPGGHTENLTFRDIASDGMAGAVVTVLGAEKARSESEIVTFARNVTVENCTLLRSGKFMWDYGYLWQVTVWPETYTPAEIAMAAKYFRNDLIDGPVRMAAGDDRVLFDNAQRLPVSKPRQPTEAWHGRDAVCFFGDAIPTNLVRGRQYFVVDSTPEFIRIAEVPGGPALRFATTAGPKAKMIHNLFDAYFKLFAPSGAGPGKGAVDLVGCQKVIVSGCRLSALGDTMHIQKSQGVVFSGNHITGSRMGAFFLAEYCKDATITGNTVDGTNGSRVISVEKSCTDVTIIGNTFRNGGRGSWINQPRNFVLADNIFVNNTTKCEHAARRGRRSFVTGDYERYAELYFTTYQRDGRYGNVVVRGNIFTSGPAAEHALTFAPGGDTLLVAGNVFRGPVCTIAPVVDCQDVVIDDNVGAEVQQNTTQMPARKFYCAAIGREVDYSAYLPEGEPPAGGWPLVVFLHGLGRNHRSLADDDRCRAEVMKHKLAVVFADGGQSWYLDSPVEPASRYQSMLRELLAAARRALPVSPKPERTGIGGWSMGGFGAMRFAEAYPQEVAAVGTAIGLLDFPNPRLPRQQNFGVSPLFGDDPQVWARLNCMADVQPLRGKAVLILTGKDAFDAQMNRNFHARLQAANVAHNFQELAGAHDFSTVQASLPILWQFFENHLR